jgi:glycine betaine/proline transport system ATP-binding protein
LDEALKIGTHIAIMKGGVIVQRGKPEEIVLSPADDYVRSFVAHTNPLNVLSGRSLMRPIEACETQGLEICLDTQGDIWLTLDQQGKLERIRRGDQVLPLQSWTIGEPLEALQSRPTLVDADIGMRDAIQIRYQTGQKIVLLQGDKVVGILGDRELYHALLGKAMG